MHAKPYKMAHKATAVVLAAMILLSMTATGASAEGETDRPSYPADLQLSVSVKQDASAGSIKTAIEEKLKTENADFPIASVVWPDNTDFTASGTHDITVNYTDGTTAAGHLDVIAVPFTGTVSLKVLPSISSTASQNVSQAALLAYVNSDLSLEKTGDAVYAAALGAVPAAGTAKLFSWQQSNNAYDPAGGFTYTFTQNHNGTIMTRDVTVNHVSQSIGSLYIDYSDATVNTTRQMRWSESRGSGGWSSCSDNMKIPSAWYGRTIYFFIPGDRYSEDSNVVSLYIPEKADRPDGKLELTATTHSITIQNCWDFDNVEYSVDGTTWRTTKNDSYTFDNLDSDRSYTVYVRERADNGNYLASDSVTQAIRTKKVISTNIDVDSYASGSTGYINGIGTIASNISSHTMKGNLTSSHMTKFNNIFDTYNKRYANVFATLQIEQYMDEDETNDIKTVNFSMPISTISKAIKGAGLELEYHSDLGRIYLENDALTQFNKGGGTLSFSIQEVTSINGGSSWDWLRGEFKSGAPVYKLSVTCGNKKAADITYFLPYKLSKNETVSSLLVYYVDSSGKRSEINTTYDSLLGGVKFTADKSGYYVITNDGYSSTTLPFKDVPENYWAIQYIRYCYDRGIVLGTSSFEFSPNITVSRAQIVTLLSRLDGFDGRFSGTSHFKDVQASDWYAPYAEWAYQKGIVNGNTFRGDDDIARQEIALMLYTYLQKSGRTLSFHEDSVQQYVDHSSINRGNRTAVLFMRYAGIMDGTGNNMFAPSSMVTRSEIAALMYRMFNYIS